MTAGQEDSGMSDPTDNKPDFMKRAIPWDKGNSLSAFEPEVAFDHHWGRTVNAGDNSLFVSLTQMYNPLYFNQPHARLQGHEDIVVAPLLVFNIVLGLSVEDLSLRGPFVGINNCEFHRTVYVGDTLTARSTVLSKRYSRKHPGAAIVTWHTQGFNQRQDLVIEYTRSNLLKD